MSRRGSHSRTAPKVAGQRRGCSCPVRRQERQGERPAGRGQAVLPNAARCSCPGEELLQRAVSRGGPDAVQDVDAALVPSPHESFPEHAADLERIRLPAAARRTPPPREHGQPHGVRELRAVPVPRAALLPARGSLDGDRRTRIAQARAARGRPASHRSRALRAPGRASKQSWRRVLEEVGARCRHKRPKPDLKLPEGARRRRFGLGTAVRNREHVPALLDVVGGKHHRVSRARSGGTPRALPARRARLPRRPRSRRSPVPRSTRAPRRPCETAATGLPGGEPHGDVERGLRHFDSGGKGKRPSRHVPAGKPRGDLTDHGPPRASA